MIIVSMGRRKLRGTRRGSKALFSNSGLVSVVAGEGYALVTVLVF